ncbi:MAG: DKNYY domain-containing protein [Candidatus Latescibacterota bacterium]
MEIATSFLLGISIWWSLFKIPQDEGFLVGMILLVVAFFAFVLVNEPDKPLIEKYIPKLFFIASIAGGLIVAIDVLFGDALDKGGSGMIVFLPLIITVSMMYGVILPFIKIMFPLYVWVFIKTDKKLFTRYGVILFVFPIIAFFTSSHGTNAIQSFGNPCYEVVEGKAPNYVIRGNNVCIVGRSTGLSTSYLKPLEGADAKTFEEIGGGYAKDKNNVYRYGVIVPGANPQTFKIPSSGGGYK